MLTYFEHAFFIDKPRNAGGRKTERAYGTPYKSDHDLGRKLQDLELLK